MVQIWVWKCKVTTSNLICCERFSRLEYHWFILKIYFLLNRVQTIPFVDQIHSQILLF